MQNNTNNAAGDVVEEPIYFAVIKRGNNIENAPHFGFAHFCTIYARTFSMVNLASLESNPTRDTMIFPF